MMMMMMMMMIWIKVFCQCVFIVICSTCQVGKHYVAKTKKAPQECHACTSRDFFLWIFPRKKYPITSSIPGSSRSSFIPKKIFPPPCQPYGGISLDGGCSTRVIKPEAMRPYKTSFWKTIKTLTQHTSLIFPIPKR